MSHPVWVCGLKLFAGISINAYPGHTLYGCVDWNTIEPLTLRTQFSHTLYGCVDWNLKYFII